MPNTNRIMTEFDLQTARYFADHGEIHEDDKTLFHLIASVWRAGKVQDYVGYWAFSTALIRALKTVQPDADQVAFMEQQAADLAEGEHIIIPHERGIYRVKRLDSNGRFWTWEPPMAA